jgi:putative transposase
MKGKRYSTEEKIRILRQADAGQSIGDVCREHNPSQVSFYRRKKQSGQMEVNEAMRLEELEKENTELKKMLADSLLENRILKFICQKKLLAQPVNGHRHLKQWKRGSVSIPPRSPLWQVSLDSEGSTMRYYDSSCVGCGWVFWIFINPSIPTLPSHENNSLKLQSKEVACQ